jgi:hypothetical protein
METNVANNMLSQKSRQKDRPQIKGWVRISRILLIMNCELRMEKQETSILKSETRNLEIRPIHPSIQAKKMENRFPHSPFYMNFPFY